MSQPPAEFTLELTSSRAGRRHRRAPRSVRAHGDALDAYPRVLCCSFHTTAGYLDQGSPSRLHQSRAGVMRYIDLFRTMFPEGAGYEHDKLERRTELTETQHPVEPLNADSHLAFMAGGLRTCVSYLNRPARAGLLRRSRRRARRPAAPAEDDGARLLARGTGAQHALVVPVSGTRSTR